MWGPASARLRVLVVDDNIDTALSLSWLLESYGHEARVAHDGLGALAVASELRPDAILLDVGLPDLDGFEVARRLRARPEFGRTLLIASTGYNREKDRLRAVEAGFDHYFVKPFDPQRIDQLFTALRSAATVPA